MSPLLLPILWGLLPGVAMRGQQDRPFAFLSYKDTIFAVRQRNTWADPSYMTDLPTESVELDALSLNKIRGTFHAAMEGWDRRTSSWNVACLDFDDVMAWAAEPRYPRSVRPAMEAREAVRGKALRLLANVLNPSAKPKELERLEKQIKIDGIEVYKADLDGSGNSVLIVSARAECRDHNPGVVFVDLPSGRAAPLCSSEDGWLHLLTVADLLHDGYMEVVAGGTTASGKMVAMWRYDHGRLTSMPQYPRSQ